MPLPGLTLLYVADPARSAAFYARLLGAEPAEASPSFVLFAGAAGPALGLWARGGVLPAPEAPAGGAELAFPSPRVDEVHAEWVAAGVEILQPPMEAEYGRNFLARDPDGHRLRVFRPAGG